MAITRSLAVFTRLSPWSIAIGAMFAFVLSACDGGSYDSLKATIDDDCREVESFAEMGSCTNEREGDTVYVAEKQTEYLCQKNTWVDLSEITDGDNSLSSSSVVSYSSDVVLGVSSAMSAPSSATSENIELGISSSSLDKDAYTGDSLVVKSRSIFGAAQKGPFKFGSPVYLRELTEDSLKYTGIVYEDEISSNKGDFVIPKVSLVSPYACVEVHGQYRNEITGGYSKDSISLFALVDLNTALSDVKNEPGNKVNVNLLTHLEYNRVLYLVRKGYSVSAAKKRANQEIMSAFELSTTVENSEDLSPFENSDDNKVNYANASLMALGLLFLGKRSDAEIKATIDNFIKDFEKDGVWDDAKTKAMMADFAAEIDASKIRANIKVWNVLSIPQFEDPLEMFWNNVYGLGGCSDKRMGNVAPNSNKLSKNYNKYFICNSTNWIAATTYQKDTYEWSAGKSGELKKGNVTDTIYIYEGSNWKVARREMTIGLCGESNAGVVSIFDGVYYICKNNAWDTATMLEYDTYGLIGVDGDVKAGVVNKDKFYVFEKGTWREVALGVCSTIHEGVVAKDGDTYYICKSESWTAATAFEYDTYGWNAGTEGEIRAGTVNVDKYYVYENGAWCISAYDFFTDSRDGKIYRMVKIGSQIWMAENLNYADSIKYPSMLKRNWCYENSLDSCAKYGRLYTWAAAIDSVKLSNDADNPQKCGYGTTCMLPTKVQGICPDGWHMPTRTEWNTLITEVGGQSMAGKVLKSRTGWSNRRNGLDSVDFSALPAGIRHSDFGFHDKGNLANFWSSTEYSDNNTAFRLYLNYDGEGADLRSIFKSFGLSVRCIQD
ncbi:fibrobacter succinogenes major paralogous domain-containing protein [Candidatus Saccharibacteria bacterium]|nr:fibrobacter succinogenes major paralogous domain-containing protein [Candidatus Saccharibacteria bacterium]